MANWWWNSAPQASKVDKASSQTSQNTSQSAPDASLQPPFDRSLGMKSGAARIDQLDREEQALDELRAAFLSSTLAAEGELNPESARARQPIAAKQPYDESLYPTYLSCSACFDQAYYCSSVGGQLTNIYRYGALRSCSELWAQWRFCMRTKTMGDEERKQRIWEWSREKEARKKLGRNSEEVWGAKKRSFDVSRGEE